MWISQKFTYTGILGNILTHFDSRKQSSLSYIFLKRDFHVEKSNSDIFACLIAPAKPNRPIVVALDVDRVKVNYIFGLGGGYTHEFLVMYRKKGMWNLN